MAINYGYNDSDINKKILRYTLNYPTLKANTATYSERETKGYKYISALGLNSESTITFLIHSFSTISGVNMSGGVVQYSFEFLDKNGDFFYYDIDEMNLARMKVPKPGKKYNIFLLNKTYNFSKIMGKTNFSDFTMFSVFVTQKTGLSSNDSSELDLLITY